MQATLAFSIRVVDEHSVYPDSHLAVCEAFLRNMVFDIWFALVIIVLLWLSLVVFVFGRAVSAFFLPLVVLVWILFFFRKIFCLWP